MKSVLLCLELLLKIAEENVGLKRKLEGETAANDKSAKELEAVRIQFEETRKQLEAALADDASMAELDKKAAEVLERVSATIGAK